MRHPRRVANCGTRTIWKWRKITLLAVSSLIVQSCGGGGGEGAAPAPYTVGGSISGLIGSGLTLTNNGGDSLSISSGSTSFSFATHLAAGAAYSIAVATQPTSPSQQCVVSGGGGSVAASNITDISVICTTSSYTVGGTVSGLNGTGLVLRDNGGDDLPITADGSFDFSTAVASGSTYNVTVAAQPAAPIQNCVLIGGSGSGTIGAANVTAVSIVCAGTARFAYVADFRDNAIVGYSINATTGALTSMPGSPFPTVSQPTTIAIGGAGKFLYVISFGGSVIAAYSIDHTTGALTSIAGVQFQGTGEPAIENLTVDPSGSFLYGAVITPGNVTVIGVAVYSINPSSGALVAVPGSPFTAGSGNTSAVDMLLVDPTDRFVYVDYSIYNATGYVTTISALSIEANGGLSLIDGSPFTTSTGGGSQGGSIDPLGKFLYVGTGPLENQIVTFAINGTTGALTELGSLPMSEASNFATDPSGNFIYGTYIGISAFSINETSGVLAEIAGTPLMSDSLTSCLAVDPSGRFLYVVGNGVLVYSIDPTTGALTSVAGSPFAGPGNVHSIAVTQ